MHDAVLRTVSSSMRPTKLPACQKENQDLRGALCILAAKQLNCTVEDALYQGFLSRIQQVQVLHAQGQLFAFNLAEAEYNHLHRQLCGPWLHGH